MFYYFQIIVRETWEISCGLFEPLPYGDPYIATITMFVLIAMSAKIIADGKTA
jgi:hypothetical protein